MNRSDAIQTRFYPEMAVAGFSHVDGSVDFWSRVNALVTPESEVLDYGAGRGAFIDADSSPYRRGLKILKGKVKSLTGCDVDPAVKANPYLDSADVIAFDKPLPYADASFDLVYASWVFEHVADPVHVARELLRVTRPNGWIAGATANRWGYVSLISSLVPNRLHGKVVPQVKPDVAEIDVFPTQYKMNTPGALKSLFGGEADVFTYRRSSEPAYHFGNSLVYGGFKILHGFLPDMLHTGLFLFAHKR